MSDVKGDEVGMRTSTALFPALAAAAAVLAPADAMATGFGGGSCKASRWTVTVLDGPCTVSNPGVPACSPDGDYTGIKYKVGGGSADHVATLVTAPNDVQVPPASQVFAPCVGDPVTGLGRRSCHEKAVKVNPSAHTREFWVVVEGDRLPVDTSVAVKKGSCVQSYEVAGLGLGTLASVTETQTHGDCTVLFTLDAATGTVLSAKLTPESITEGCQLRIDDVTDIEVTLGGVPLGTAQFGNGVIQTGNTSCTTRIIGGRVYSWGDTCQ